MEKSDSGAALESLKAKLVTDEQVFLLSPQIRHQCFAFQGFPKAGPRNLKVPHSRTSCKWTRKRGAHLQIAELSVSPSHSRYLWCDFRPLILRVSPRPLREAISLCPPRDQVFFKASA